METLGAVAAPFALGALPELAGAAFMPTAGEAALGAAAGEAAPMSLGALTGGIGGAGFADTGAGGGALSAFDQAPGGGFTGIASGATPNIETLAPFAQTPVAPEIPAAQTPMADLGGASWATPQGLDYSAYYTDPATAGVTDPTMGGGTAGAPSAAPAPTGMAVSDTMTGGGINVGAGGPAAQPQSFGQAFTGNLTKMAENPLSYVGLGGLGYNLYQGAQQKKALTNLQSQEAQLAQNAAQNAQQLRTEAQPEFAQGELLTQYLTTGTLPAAAQAQLDRMVQAQKAQIIQGYASRGQSTDPLQNTALQQDLANVDQNKQVAAASLQNTYAQAGQNAINMANQLLASGLRATDIAAQIPINMQKLNIELNTQTANALASFSAALGGGMRPQQLPGQPAPSYLQTAQFPTA